MPHYLGENKMNVFIAPDTIENCPNCQEWVFPEYSHSVGYSHYHEQDCHWQTCPNCNYSDEGDWESIETCLPIEYKEFFST
jgi:hypothetical protein